MRGRWAAVAVLAVAMAACGHEANKDYAAMNKIPMQSVCVGRMLVDLPKGAPLDWQQQFDYARVSRLPGTIDDAQKFWSLVDSRKQQVEQSTVEYPNGKPVVYKKYGDRAAILLIRDPDAEELGYAIDDTERYLWIGRWGYKYKTGALSDKEAIGLLPDAEKTFGQLVPINNYDPPAEAGFCIDGAMVTGKIGPIWSSPSSTVKGWKDVTVDLMAREDDGSRAKLSWEKVGHPLPPVTPFSDLEMFKSWADESKQSSGDERVVSFEVLRKGNRQLAGMPGEEIAVKAKLANGQEWYRFEWSSSNDAARPRKSGFTFDLEAGDQDYTSNYAPPPPQDDLLALWDAMLGSLKPRPGGQ